MRLPLTLALIAATALTACGAWRESRINPKNWFGRSEEVQVAAPASDNLDAEGRSLVQSVTSMTVEPYPGGAIVRATGLPPTQGWWNAELVALPVDENGVLVLEFRVFPPIADWPASTPVSRQITAAISLSDIRLEPVRTIVVQGETNARSSRR